MDLDVDYATTLLAAVLLGVGFVLQQFAAQQEPDSRFLSWRILTDLLRQPRWLLGIGCMVAGYLLAAWSIGHLELTLVEPLLTTYLVWALILAVPMSRQPVKAAEVTGALILCAGVALVSATRSTTPIGLSFGSFSHWYAAAIIAGIAAVAVVIGHRRQGQVRATLTGLGAGLVFGIQDALTRQTLESMQYSSWTVLFSTWSAYALVGAGIVGIWLMQNAFSAGPLHYSLPTVAAGEPVAGIALGILVFGDRIQITPGQLAIEAGGIAALIVGVVAVAQSSAFSGLHKITDAIRPGAEADDHPAPRPTLDTSPNGKHPPAPSRSKGSEARKLSRPAHRRQVHDSPSGGESAEPPRRPARRRAGGPRWPSPSVTRRGPAPGPAPR